MARSNRLRVSLSALGGQLGEQWERDRRDTLFLLGATALAAVPHFGHLPAWTLIGFALLFVWRLGLVLWGRPLPAAPWRWIGALAVIAAVFAHYKTLLGRDPGVALLVLFLGLKMMEMRARRDLFVVLFLCFFLLLTGFFYSQSMLNAAITVLAVLALVTTMLTMQFGTREAPVGRRFRTAGGLMLQALPIAAAMFLLFPRLQGPLWNAPGDGDGARTGLSDEMTPGVISQLTGSDEVAFRVLFEREPPPNEAMYWRGPVFGQFDGRTWRALPRNRQLQSPQPEVQHRRDVTATRFTVTLEPTAQPWLFALDVPASVNLPGMAVQVSPELVLTAAMPLASRVRYDADSILDYRVGLNETQLSLRNWVSLPAGFNPKTLEMALAWRSETADDAALVDRALRMIREQPFRYTMSPPLLGRDGVDDFLFGTRAGFCEHYSGAFVVLMRAMDIPARIVTGYQGGERNPVDGYWVVRQADAHAWAEVWLNGRGWVRVDPTSAVAPERIERGARALQAAMDASAASGAAALWRNWKLNFDAMGNAWNQWVLSYDQQRQGRLLDALGLDIEDWLDLAGVLAVTLAVLIGGAALFTLHPRRSKDPVERLYAEFCLKMARSGLPRAAHETAGKFLARVERALDPEQALAARRIISTYNRMRYADDTVDAQAVRTLRLQIRRFDP